MNIKHKTTAMVYAFLLLAWAGGVGIACSESSDAVDEYANWQQRNEEFFATLEDSLAANGSQWMKVKSYAKDQSLANGKATDCIYVKKIKAGTGTECPKATDSVRVSYEGRLIPTATYPQGYPFDTRAFSTFRIETNATSKMKLASSIDGFLTALLHMHQGDYWRVYIPHQLGYQDSEQSTIPAYSTLVFDIVLIDFVPVGHPLPAWGSRQTAD